MKLGFIGAGRLAAALAKRFHQVGHEIVGIHSRSFESAQKLAVQVESTPLPHPPEADLIFLTVPDDAIQIVASRLISKGSAVVHTSGVHSLEVLAPLTPVGSFHPLYPFRDGTTLTGQEGMLIAIEASDSILAQQLTQLGQDLGGQPALLKLGEKTRYHAAAVMASNYLVTLFSVSLDLMTQAGISPQIAQGAIANLMQGNLDNLRQLDPSSALTGPVARGDLATIQKHLQGLFLTDYTKSYCELGRLTVTLAPNLDSPTRQALLDLFLKG